MRIHFGASRALKKTNTLQTNSLWSSIILNCKYSSQLVMKKYYTPWNWQQKILKIGHLRRTFIFQPSIFWSKLLVSGRVYIPLYMKMICLIQKMHYGCWSCSHEHPWKLDTAPQPMHLTNGTPNSTQCLYTVLYVQKRKAQKNRTLK